MGRRLLPRLGLLLAFALLGACGPGGAPVAASGAPADAASAPAPSPAAVVTDNDLPFRRLHAPDRTLAAELPLPLATGTFGKLPIGLVVRLLTRDGAPGVDVIVRGAAWVAAHGCDAPTTVWIPGWGRDACPALARVLADALHAVGRDPGQVEVLLAPGKRDADALRRDVDPIVREVAAAGVEAVHVLFAHADRAREGAVERGLRWLAAHQAPDGSWAAAELGRWCGSHAMQRAVDLGPVDASANVSNTGLALTAFLGAGYTNRGRHRFAKTVSKGLRHLKDRQDRGGAFDASPERHAIAALAMVEAYGMTGSPIFKGSAQRALDHLTTAWREAPRDEGATTWMVMPMGSALLVNEDAVRRGKPAPLHVDEGLLRDIRLEARAAREDGGALSTAAAPLVWVLLGERRPPRPELQSLAERIPLEPPGLAHRYFGTLSCHHAGGEPWKRWGKALQETLLPSQRHGGSPCCFEGSWDPVAAPDRVAATALSLLCLEVYYRYDQVWSCR